MAFSLNDQYILSTDTTFQHRVQVALFATCIAVGNEDPKAVPFHRERADFARSILTFIGAGVNPYVTQFTISVPTDATNNVINDATQNGTVALTAANVAAQAALVTDAHITAAISSQFNAFQRQPAG